MWESTLAALSDAAKAVGAEPTDAAGCYLYPVDHHSAAQFDEHRATLCHILEDQASQSASAQDKAACGDNAIRRTSQFAAFRTLPVTDPTGPEPVEAPQPPAKIRMPDTDEERLLLAMVLDRVLSAAQATLMAGTTTLSELSPLRQLYMRDLVAQEGRLLYAVELDDWAWLLRSRALVSETNTGLPRNPPAIFTNQTVLLALPAPSAATDQLMAGPVGSGAPRSFNLVWASDLVSRANQLPLASAWLDSTSGQRLLLRLPAGRYVIHNDLGGDRVFVVGAVRPAPQAVDPVNASTVGGTSK